MSKLSTRMRRLGFRITSSNTLKRLAGSTVAVSFLASPAAWAASGTWTGAADNNWQTGSNWSPSMPGATSGYASTDSAFFGTAGSGLINLGDLINIQNINFGIGSGNASAFTIGDADDVLALTNAGSILVGTGVTSSQQIGSAGTVINLASGAATTYAFTNNSSTSGAKLNVAGNIVGNSTGATTLTLGGVNGGTISGNMSAASGSLAVTKLGTGTWALTGANSYSGATSVSGGGTLDIGGGTSTGSITGSALTLGNSTSIHGGVLSYSRSGANNQTFTGATIAAGSSAIVSAVSTGTVSLGALSRQFGGTVDFSGPGAIRTTSANANGIIGGWATFGASTWAVSGTANPISGLSTYVVSNAATTAPGTAANVDVQASNSTAWNSQSVNTLRFNTGSATTLTVAAGQTLDVSTGGILVTSAVGNNLSLITGGTLTANAGVGSVTVIQNNTSNSLTIDSVIAGSSTADGLTKSGAGTLVLNGANTYLGRTYVSAGTLKLGSATAFGDAASVAAITFAAGSTLDLNGITYSSAAGRTINFFGSSIINSSTAAVSWVNNWVGLGLNTVNAIDGAGDINFTGLINNGRLVKSGSATLTISSAGSNTGATLVANGGTSVLNSSSADGALRGIDGNGNVLTVNTGGVVKYAANDQIRSATDTATGIVAVYGGTLDINSKTDTINGLQIGSTDGSTAGNVISTGGAGALTVTGSTVAFGANRILATNGTASANLAGATTSLTKSTSGTVALSGANTYGAGTTVSLGTLLANTPTGGTNSATGTGAVTVVSTAVLGGTGQIRPTGVNGISVASGGHIAPGASIGTLTIDSGGSTAANILTMAAGSDFRFELGAGGTFVAPGLSDRLVIANSAVGDVVFNSNAIDFLGGGAAGTYLLFDGLASAVEGSDSWVGLTLGGISGREIITGLTVTNLGSGLTGTLYLGDGTSLGQAGDIYLSVVPEPSTLAFLVGGMGILAGLRRRRSN